MSLSVTRASDLRWLKTTTDELWPLLPLLGLYIVVVFFTASPSLQNDEVNYAEAATRLAGHPDETHQVGLISGRLWYGPGYPLILVPFVALNLPWITAKYLNAAFLFGAIIYFYYLMRRYFPREVALLASICLGVYPPCMRELHGLYTEPFVCFLICGLTLPLQNVSLSELI